MPDEERKIIIDQDWKQEAQREKERLAKEVEQVGPLPAPSFAELLNLIMVQAMAGMGLLPGPGGERLPPNLEMAKHFVDMLQVLEDKTKGNLTPEEQALLDQVLYESRMTFVQVAGGGGAAPGGGRPVPPPK